MNKRLPRPRPKPRPRQKERLCRKEGCPHEAMIDANLCDVHFALNFPAAVDAKDANPKDTIGAKKIGSTLVPDVIVYFASLGLLEGALKYGTANWSEAGIRCSIYLDACGRHLAKFKAGEWADPKTRVPHLASAIACIGIILDANLRGMITDDRPPANPGLIAWMDEAQSGVEHLKQTFAEHDPKHYTMQDVAPPGRLYGADQWVSENDPKPITINTTEPPKPKSKERRVIKPAPRPRKKGQLKKATVRKSIIRSRSRTVGRTPNQTDE